MNSRVVPFDGPGPATPEPAAVPVAATPPRRRGDGGAEWVAAPALEDGGGIRHAFFTRKGGVSQGIYAALNCGLGSNDDAERVRANRARAMQALGLSAEALATVVQVHSAAARVVRRPWPDGERPAADALVTDRPGVALGILTADCAPVLFADAGAGVIGAAHAGWRGARDGILEATLAAMADLGAARGRIAAAVGPAIRQASYEVGDDFRAQFIAAEPDASRLFVPAARPRHGQFDLAGHVAGRLARAGVGSVSVLPLDTCADEEHFFSYRRVTLAGGGDYGRQLSAIVLAD